MPWYKNVPTLEKWQEDSPGDANLVNMRFGRLAGLVPKWRSQSELVEIDKLVELYQKAYQPMSKRNVLFDLQTELEKFHSPLAGVSSDAIKALKDVVTLQLAGMPNAGRYTKVICIGWCVGCNYNKASNAITTRYGNPDYFRHSKTDVTDMRRKCEDMFAAIDHALNFMPNHPKLKASANDTNTLKIFMAPEFYFRGEHGAYPLEIVQQIIPTMQMLGASTRGTNGHQYADWLFIFGTAVAAFLNDDGTAEVQNVALVQKGEEVAIVQKEYVSPIDYKDDKVRVGLTTLPRAGYPLDQEKTVYKTGNVVPSRGSTDSRLPPSTDPNYKIVTQNDERLSGVRLTIDGIRIALEVCLDHDKKRAAPLAASTQILLIPSYGMDITHHNCLPGGVIFNVDGRQKGSSLVYVNGSAANQGPQQVTGTGFPSRRGKVQFWGPYFLPY
jgi:hypothetical protein